MTQDEIEAETFKYSPQVIMFLPLASGAVAIFNHKRELLSIAAPTELGNWLSYRPHQPPAPLNLAEILGDML